MKNDFSCLLCLIQSPDGVKQEDVFEMFKDASKEELLKITAQISEMFNYNFIKRIKRTNERFGTSSEGMPSLFEELPEGHLDANSEAASILENLSQEQDDEEIVQTAKRKKKKRTLHDNINNLPKFINTFEPTGPEFEVVKDKCSQLKSLVYDQLVFVPGQYYVKRDIYPVYVYEDENGETHTFQAQPQTSKLFPGSYASSSLTAKIISDKVVLGIPFYRQEQDFNRQDIYLTRQTMTNWGIETSEQYLESIYDCMVRDLKLSGHIHMDETPLRILESSKSGGNKMGTIIVTRTSWAEKYQMAVYHATQRKDKQAFLDFLDQDYSGTIICDAADVHRVFKDATLAFCMAHARRKLTDHLKTRRDYKAYLKLSDEEKVKYLEKEENLGLKLTLDALTLFQKLYRIERTAKNLHETPEQIQIRRDKESRPVFEALEALMWKISDGAAAKSELKKAADYFIKNRKELAAFLEDGATPIDDNACERMVKPFVMARKNFLFSNTFRGAKATAVCFTILQSAILNGLDPRKYLVYVLDVLSTQGLQDHIVEELLPYSKTLPADLYVEKAEY